MELVLWILAGLTLTWIVAWNVGKRSGKLAMLEAIQGDLNDGRDIAACLAFERAMLKNGTIPTECGLEP